MSFDGALYEQLKAHAATTALVGTGTSARIFPAIAPTSAAVPRITYHRIANSHVHHMGGASGLTATTMQIDCWDDDYLGANALGETVRDALDGYRGTMGTGGQTSAVQATFLNGDRTDFFPPTDASQIGFHRVMMEFVFWHTETVPDFV